MGRRWIVMTVLVVMGLSRMGESQERFGITADKIAQALAANGIHVSDAQVVLPARVVATEPSPQLDVLSVRSFASGVSVVDSEVRTWFRMGCHRIGSCLPFYAIVVGPGGQTASAAIKPAARSSRLSMLLERKSEVTIQAGAHATLVLDDRRSRIRVSVISLEKGTTGSKIRVASPDHKQFYIAEVVSSNQLKASF